eukprot:TRINITY_DN6302_c0_g1_i1.p2 TRINITY_DN6302_c0_g1~~TRINITY_DN6302_c0_g1_i1.p2  ORF type:complete len:171 (+),score=4.38 TRINITY_DN6302_c0_g1_i1:1041-1553(+)
MRCLFRVSRVSYTSTLACIKPNTACSDATSIRGELAHKTNRIPTVHLFFLLEFIQPPISFHTEPHSNTAQQKKQIPVFEGFSNLPPFGALRLSFLPAKLPKASVRRGYRFISAPALPQHPAHTHTTPSLARFEEWEGVCDKTVEITSRAGALLGVLCTSGFGGHPSLVSH